MAIKTPFARTAQSLLSAVLCAVIFGSLSACGLSPIGNGAGNSLDAGSSELNENEKIKEISDEGVVKGADAESQSAPVPKVVLEQDASKFSITPPQMHHVNQQYFELLELLKRWINEKTLARTNGYIYGIDLGQALVVSAQADDRQMYEQLSALARKFVSDSRDDPYTKGFTVWRYKPGQEFDASGTAEALWIAKGLWLGAKQFDVPEDRLLAETIVDGYVRHEYVEHGTWLIRNYFNFGVRGFATNSFLVNYYPDFVAEVAEQTGDSDIRRVARKSAELFRSARTPSGLLYSMIQPEVETMFPGKDLHVFSPNDIVNVSESCAVAETAVLTVPEIARSVYDFTLNASGEFRYVRAASGKPIDSNLDPTTAICNLRLALHFQDTNEFDEQLNLAQQHAGEFIKSPSAPRVYQLTQILMSYQSVREAYYAQYR